MHRLLRIVVLGILAAAVSPAYPQTLRQAAERDGILIGAAVNARYLSEPAYTGTLAREFNMIEPEDAMKWGALRPDRSSFDFHDADAIAAFARLHGMKVRGHNLVWHNHNPKWLEDGHWPPGQLSRILHEHIQRVMGHFRGKVFAWDVVNEAFDENGKLRHSLWYDRPGIGQAANGTAYIEQAFRWAHAADPQALLFYNDADAETLNPHSDAIYALVKDFKQRGVPIDGVGFEMHVHDLNPDFQSMAKNFDRFARLGVQIQITEMDAGIAVDAEGNPLHAGDIARQAEIYARVARICLENRACTALQTWGFTDKYSWIPWFTQHGKGAALLFDREYRAKPAYGALLQELEKKER